jgi:outer membrane murein-binding lipoprotein Lpp
MKGVAVIAVALGLSGCVAQNDSRLQKADETAKVVESLKSKLDELGAQILTLQTDVLVLQGGVNPYETAEFDPSSPGGYSRIDTIGGTFLVSIKNVAPYVDGFRITCNFGNPSSVTFKGFKLKAKWGPRRDFKVKGFSFSKWRTSLREKELSLTDSLQPGAWNPVTFVLAPAKADEFGYLELSINTDTISLRQ